MPNTPSNRPIDRRTFVAALAASVAAAPSACNRTEPPAPAESAPRAPAVVTGRDRLNLDLPKPNGLNMIIVVADTFRADHIGAYGSTRVKTPHIDRFAAESVVCENNYADALPTLPTRRVWMAGKSLLNKKSPWWAPLDREDVTIAELLSKLGYRTGLIADTFHYFKPGMNFHQGFQSFEWIRGQETDAWISGPMAEYDVSRHMPAHLLNERYVRMMQQYMANTAARKGENDYFCAQTVSAAMQWLERTRAQQPLFLWIDMFDPHEPWDAPPRYQKMYRDDYGYERYLFGYGVRNEDVLDSDYPVLRDLYAAEVSFSDYWIGRLLEKIDALGMRDDTIVVFASDHGTHLGELGCVQKTPGLLNSAVAHIPMMIRHPDASYAGRRIEGLVSSADYMPTWLSLLGIDGFPGLDGQSFWPMAAGGPAPHERTFIGYGAFAAVRDARWHYFQNFRGKDTGKGPALYDLEADPGETANVAADHPDVVAERRDLIAQRFDAELPLPAAA